MNHLVDDCPEDLQDFIPDFSHCGDEFYQSEPVTELSRNNFFEDPFVEADNLLNQVEQTDLKSVKYPNVEGCFPQWKRKFPWVYFKLKENVFVCHSCHRLLSALGSKQVKKAHVFTLREPKDVVIVAKRLRIHSDNPYHTIGIYFSSYKWVQPIVTVFDSVFGSHSNSDEFQRCLQTAMKSPDADISVFAKAIKTIGREIEFKLLERMRKCLFYSVVADQCRGLVIVKMVEDNCTVSEVVIWSYLTIFDQTPLQYLRAMNLDPQRLTFYIANAPCQQCPRCLTTKITLAQLPPRPPPVRVFAKILWGVDLLKPLLFVVKSVAILWKSFPFKFDGKCGDLSIESLGLFMVQPTRLILLIKQFEAVKKIAADIYVTMHHVEALGLSKLTLINEERTLKVLTILEEIMTVADNASKQHVIGQKQIVTLSQALCSLRIWSNGVSFIKIDHDSTSASQLPGPYKSKNASQLIYIVEKFIDENQKTVYYSGREKLSYFYDMCDSDQIISKTENGVDVVKLASYFDIVYLAVCTFLKMSSKESTLASLTQFHHELNTAGLKTTDVLSVLNIFKKYPAYRTKFMPCFWTYIVNASLPFQPANLEKDLFSSATIQEKYDTTIWSKLDKDLKPFFLYVHSEIKNFDPKIMMGWWRDTLQSDDISPS